MTQNLNRWIGILFAIGSSLFMLASALSLLPTLAQTWSIDSAEINRIYFAGSIPFTTAAYLQLFQAANSSKKKRRQLIGWRPHDLDWLSAALQFVGTILFNINTFDAMVPSLDWLQQDLLIWAPDIIGSVLFLASGYLAFIEMGHAYWTWQPKHLSWWCVFTNLLGCIGFMISALFAIALPGITSTEAVAISTVFTLLGAIGFLIGSLLMLPESEQPTVAD